jgi:hypothetical protein
MTAKIRRIIMSIWQMFFGAITAKDNQTIDLGRVLWLQGMLLYFGITLYDLYKGGDFDATNWATGFGIALAAGGAALGLKAMTEPTGKD